eukprot:1159566-Pelagomonas_calceolata.AAC.3
MAVSEGERGRTVRELERGGSTCMRSSHMVDAFTQIVCGRPQRYTRCICVSYGDCAAVLINTSASI